MEPEHRPPHPRLVIESSVRGVCAIDVHFPPGQRAGALALLRQALPAVEALDAAIRQGDGTAER